MSGTMQRDEILVTTDWLAEHLDDPKVRIVDCRSYSDGYVGQQEFMKGHIPGAVYLDWSNLLSEKEKPLAFKVASRERLKRVMEQIGVIGDSLLVGYDDEGGHFVSRVWLVMSAYGRGNQVRIVDGGILKWIAEGRPLSTEYAMARLGTFEPGEAETDHLLTAEQVMAARSDPNARIVDVRRRTEFTGEEARAKRGGRIPGATHVFWQENLDWGGTREFLSADQIRARYEAAGITPDQRVITYCQGAVRAAHSALALKLAGYPNVQIYDGSWEEWGSRDDLPIESGEPGSSA